MLKKIPTDQVELGMYLHSMEGSWLSHPFWKTKFQITNPADLLALRSSKVPQVWINISLGKDVVGPKADLPRQPAAAAPPPAPSTRTRRPAPPKPVSVADELEEASSIMRQSRTAVVEMLNEARMGQAVHRDTATAVVDSIAGSVWRNPSALISLARLKTRDDYTYMHSVAVCAMMIALGRQLGLSEAEQRLAGEGGLLHDVGKMLMPLEVLNKPGQLTDEEFAIMKAHPERGHAALVASGGFGPEVLEVCLHHHEKMDGNGYPHRLAGEQITLLSRMGAVCDVYDAVTSVRPYKQAWDPAVSLARMAQWKGHFDPKVFQAFIVSVGIYPVGTLVRLQSGKLAVVIDQNPGKLTSPKVRVFFSTKSNMPIQTRDLDLGTDSSDRILGREDPEPWGFTHLNDLWTQAG